jgi:hypothetical protein
MPTRIYKPFLAACGIAALLVGQPPAHAGGLLNGLGNTGAVANGYQNPYGYGGFPSPQQQLYDQQLPMQQHQLQQMLLQQYIDQQRMNQVPR